MARKNHNLDNFFREKLSGYEAPGKTGSWQTLDHLLDRKERRKKTIKRLLFASLFLLLVVSAVVVFIPGSKKGNDVTGSNQNYSSGTAPAVIEAKDGKEKGTTSLSDSAGTMQMPDVVHSSGKDEASGNAIAGQKATNNNNKVVLTDKNKASAEAKSASKNTKTTSGTDININTGNRPDINTAAKDEDVTNENMVAIDVPISKEQEETGEKGVKDTGPRANDNETVEHKPTGDVNSGAVTVVEDSLTASNTVETAATDSSYKASKDSLPLNPGAEPRFGFNIFAGINLYRTQDQAMSDQRSISPLAGIELTRELSKHFSVGLAAMYCLQGGYNLSDTATQIYYFLEKNISQQTILIHKQHKLYVPLNVYYIISKKHAASIGLQWSYLINTVCDYTERNQHGGSTTLEEKKNVKGYMDGINNSSFSLALGYRFSLSKRFDIHARILQELGESYSGEYFYQVNASPSWSLQTFLSYKF